MLPDSHYVMELVALTFAPHWQWDSEKAVNGWQSLFSGICEIWMDLFINEVLRLLQEPSL